MTTGTGPETPWYFIKWRRTLDTAVIWWVHLTLIGEYLEQLPSAISRNISTNYSSGIFQDLSIRVKSRMLMTAWNRDSNCNLTVHWARITAKSYSNGKGVYGIISLQPYDSLFQDINLSLIYGLTVGIGIFLSITATTGFCLACNVRTPIVYVHISLLMVSCCAIFSSAIILLFYEVSISGPIGTGKGPAGCRKVSTKARCLQSTLT